MPRESQRRNTIEIYVNFEREVQRKREREGIIQENTKKIEIKLLIYSYLKDSSERKLPFTSE